MKNNYKSIKILKYFLPYGLVAYLRKREKTKKREKLISCGPENSDKTFYIVGVVDIRGGLFWLVLWNLNRIAYALEKGWIPVVDWQNYPNQYLENTSLHKENAWEYYFEQPCGYDLNAISHSKNIIRGLERLEIDGLVFDNYLEINDEYFPYFKKVFKQYLRFNETTRNYIENEYRMILQDKGKVLGVLCRGTDYTLKKPAGHPIQPTPEKVIKKAWEVMSNQNLDYIYLATEDQGIYELFRKKFGEKLITNKQDRFSKQDLKQVQYLYQIKRDRERDKYFLGLEYLSSLYLLSKCNSFIGGRTRGTIGVLLMTDGFEYQYIWNLGIFPYDL
ncbi:hypothetical protein FACS1894174_03580 [Bacteroidia bacterium]|nr:hypothetical protein FACS1894203_5070 [Bacteroidia bacterium]GHV20914.1 hypothetical protein FACS1894174_03580 [Bacteroidia bacterium]